MVAMVKKTNLSDFASKLVPWRIWVQSAFLLVWLDPLGLRLHSMCSPVFHCYACPLSTFACPIGVIAQFSALQVFPFVAIGLLIAIAALFGSLICGWACPFGLLQDLVAKIPTPKFDLPKWAAYFRYVVLIGAVLAVPYFFGEEHPLFVCRICPAGALEAAVPNMTSQAIAGQEVAWPNALKLAVLGLFLIAMFFVKRPWCRILCPFGFIACVLGRVSFFKIDQNENCNECGICESVCPTQEAYEKSSKGECYLCNRCIGACPSNALDYSFTFERD